jgi:hypothetical protein
MDRQPGIQTSISPASQAGPNDDARYERADSIEHLRTITLLQQGNKVVCKEICVLHVDIDYLGSFVDFLHLL